MDITQNYFYSAMYSAWCFGLLLGTLVAFLVTKHDYKLVEKRRYQAAKAAKTLPGDQNKILAGAVRRARLAALRDARAVLKQSQNLNDAERKLVEVERRTEAS
jgi:hypothetical protein